MNIFHLSYKRRSKKKKEKLLDNVWDIFQGMRVINNIHNWGCALCKGLKCDRYN
jgi:hypothetical protein